MFVGPVYEKGCQKPVKFIIMDVNFPIYKEFFHMAPGLHWLALTIER